MQCRVCEGAAAGLNFGAFTCEGCKSFFGRAANQQASIQGCENNYRCPVKACRACRLRKCLMVGMSKFGSPRKIRQ